MGRGAVFPHELVQGLPGPNRVREPSVVPRLAPDLVDLSNRRLLNGHPRLALSSAVDAPLEVVDG